MSKKIIATILAMLILISGTICFAKTEDTAKTGTGYKVVIEDDANLLTSEDKQDLYKTMEKLTEYGNIIFKSITKNTYSSTEKYASNYYHNVFGTQSGTLFLIDMDKRIVYIFSDGNNYKTITSAKAETITDNIYKYASKKQYYKCAEEAFSQVYTLLEGGKIAEPMKNISNVVISIMLALFINFLIFKSATEVKRAKSGELLKECEKYFEHTPPEVKETGTHRVYSPVQSSSGGGSSGGGRRRRKQRRWRRPQFLKGRKKDWQPPCLPIFFSSFSCIKSKPFSYKCIKNNTRRYKQWW